MKNIQKKFIALLMAMAMVISCTAAVSAAEAKTVSSDADAQVIFLSESNSARAQRILCNPGGITSEEKDYLGRPVDANKPIYIHINSNAEVLVRLYRNNSFNADSVQAGFRVPSTNMSGQTFVLGTIDRTGVYAFRVQITNGGQADYVIWQDIG